ncbi:hypothetical protein BASA81_006509 [Batrachochytrium salamandrivorans]|nr:hypothetical protein BASA81_006509 [Batrachochytrium salamandrivorans]
MAIIISRSLKVKLAVVVLVLAVLEQIRFRFFRAGKERHSLLPGPNWTLPLFGGIFDIVRNPHKFWEDQRAFGALSWNSICGVFMVFAHDRDVVRSAFAQNGKDSFTLMLHPNANQILGKDNIAFMSGPSHRRLRGTFLTLFTPKALSSYLDTQLELIQSHRNEWLRDQREGEFVEMWPKLRDLNALTSQQVFLGKHLRDPQRFSDLFVLITQGFLSLPLNLPGTGLYKAVKAREEIEGFFTDAVHASKLAMSNGEQPACLLDFWATYMMDAAKTATSALEHSSDREMGLVMLDFLFAAQDASTSSLLWTLCLLDEHPQVLQRVREEQAAVTEMKLSSPFERLGKMTYTKAVVMEILRFRPPAPMVPFLAEKDMELNQNFSIKKGSMLFADIWKPTIEGFPNGLEFDPDRMLPERREDVKYKESFLTFGFGPHLCVGQHYAINHLVIFLSELAQTCEWERKITGQSQVIDYRPTVCPGDCLIKFKRI